MKRLYSTLLMVLAVAAIVITGCDKDEKVPPPMADFTVQAAKLAVTFTPDVKNVRYYSWDFGDGSPVSTEKSPSHFYDDGGNYTVTLTVTGRDGSTLAKSQEITVTAPVNYIQGGKFETAEDEAKWTKFAINLNNNITWARNDGKMIASGGNGGHAGIYQAIQVEANTKYQFSMLVSGSGATDTWFEVYFGSFAPVEGNDYSDGGTVFGLNTWAGCGNSTFSGNIATLGCAGSNKDKNGEITFSQSGTVYLVIKTGGANLGTGGIAIDNVTLSKVE
ncbi:PKD domain-containing protein [Rubrolithibacter danxiaensis]|uniref:PKD domain-containing protein n=1 Tax=Rubrolithibacter danxiaensis TaxID=3390805 RepID=UPI003BF7B461